MNPTNPINILIVDDDENTRKTFSKILKLKGYNVEEADTGAKAVAFAKERFFHIVGIDVRLPDLSGLDVLRAIREINEDTIIIMVTAYASIDSSIEAINKGAYSYLTKPLNMDAALVVIEKGLEKQRLSMENKRLLQELKEANEELKKLDQLKSDFVSHTSHELRTPLTAIKEGIGIVLDGSTGPINEEQKDFLDTAKRNVDRLARLINNVLDFQKLESGKMPFNIQENDINEVIKEVQKTMGPPAKAKGLDCIINLDDNLPKIKFDRDKITQVLTNLVNNAIKFTEKGAIRITTSQDKDIVKVSVEDTGPGIQQEDVPKLFQRFAQLEKSIEKKTGGTGLGLAISNEFISVHEGKIWVESEFGKGSIFYFTIPKEPRKKRIGEILVADGLITEEQLRRELEKQQSHEKGLSE